MSENKGIILENLNSDPSNPPEGLLKNVNGVPKLADSSGNMIAAGGWDIGTTVPGTLQEGEGFLDVSVTPPDLYVGPSGGGSPNKISNEPGVPYSTENGTSVKSIMDGADPGRIVQVNGGLFTSYIQKVNTTNDTTGGSGISILKPSFISVNIFFGSGGTYISAVTSSGNSIFSNEDVTTIRTSTGFYNFDYITGQTDASNISFDEVAGTIIRDESGNAYSIEACSIVPQSIDANFDLEVKDTAGNAVNLSSIPTDTGWAVEFNIYPNYLQLF